MLIAATLVLIAISLKNSRNLTSTKAGGREVVEQDMGLGVNWQKSTTNTGSIDVHAEWNAHSPQKAGDVYFVTVRSEDKTLFSSIDERSVLAVEGKASYTKDFLDLKLPDGNYYVQVRFLPVSGSTVFLQKRNFLIATGSGKVDRPLANRERFGVGWGYATMKFMNSFDWEGFGVSWYGDWGVYTPPKAAKALAQKSIVRLSLVGGYRGDEYSAANCDKLKSVVNANPDAFPSGTMWTVGNELGWDQPSMTAAKYVDDFAGWRRCVKELAASIGADWQVGSGAIVSPWSRHPRNPPPQSAGCVSDPDASDALSGANYLRKYVLGIRSKYGAGSLPEFYVMHGYYDCVPKDIPENSGVTDEKTIQLNRFKKTVTKTREVMSELGLRDKHLIMKEFFTSRDGYPDGNDAFMMDSVNFLMRATNTTTGNPNDGNHLVQRFAWFVLTNGPQPKWNPLAYNNWDGDGSLTGQLTSLGKVWKSLANRNW